MLHPMTVQDPMNHVGRVTIDDGRRRWWSGGRRQGTGDHRLKTVDMDTHRPGQEETVGHRVNSPQDLEWADETSGHLVGLNTE